MPSGRRFFLIGAGALITSAFVSKVTAHVEKTGRPLLVRPDRSDHELYRLEDGLLSLGPYKHVTEVPVPSWREFFARTGQPVATRADLAQIEEEWFLSESDLDQEADGYAWETHWERHEGPAARAYKLLEKLDLGALRRPRGVEVWKHPLEFIDGGHPGDDSRWVTAEDPVTATLLQARLTELGTGIRLVFE